MDSNMRTVARRLLQGSRVSIALRNHFMYIHFFVVGFFTSLMPLWLSCSRLVYPQRQCFFIADFFRWHFQCCCFHLTTVLLCLLDFWTKRCANVIYDVLPGQMMIVSFAVYLLVSYIPPKTPFH